MHGAFSVVPFVWLGKLTSNESVRDRRVKGFAYFDPDIRDEFPRSRSTGKHLVTAISHMCSVG
jgi:hypothetical protein